ncbi:DUF1697 domain-containing protein [Gramella sp. AN32]|uniref:DUF1697 domain-containing protein n=1 Tax=Christiangramia antarctica TaxID=2058158 RepID=A0ABW5X6D5_9FLAO|nr:DUF1697 domain-containing protein [Gramella sp. AN32]MCM4158194.1 hypothetical protein [Gramella sp. AN32]
MKFIGFLRGINVGGKHKLPMDDLKKVLSNMGYTNISTVLNSGNIIFESEEISAKTIESDITLKLKKEFHFDTPTIIIKADDIKKIYRYDPFSKVKIDKNIRLYITFLKSVLKSKISIPWISEDNSFRIIKIEDKMVLSVLDLNIAGTIDAMKNLEKLTGKNVTTRNWNTVEKIVKKLDEKKR